MSLLLRMGSFAAIACLSLANADTARAHSVIVDPSGGGDFTTVQAALNSVAASFPPETVIVRAGAHAETVTLPQRDSQSLLVCPAGPESTSVAGLLLGPSSYGVGSTHRDWVVRGLSVGASVLSTPSKVRARFEQCAFAAGFTVDWLEGGIPMPVSECEFHGPTSLLGIYGIAQSLRFRNAPLRTEPRVGGLYYMDCTFAGAPGETLVVAPRTEDLGFTRCTFDSAGVGVWFPNGGYTGLSMNRCRFRRLALAVGELPISPVLVFWAKRPLTVNDSEWEYCDRALSWPGGVLTLARDTLRFCGDGAVQCKVEVADFRNLLVEDNFGTALDVTLAQSVPSQDPSAYVQQSLFRRVAGVGARIRQSEYPDLGSIWLGSCRFERCVTGAELSESALHAQGCVFFANEQHGLVMTPSLGMIVSAESNSFIANGGDGFWLRPDMHGSSALVDIQHDLAAHNSGAGVRLEGGVPYTFSRNDSWSNTGGDFVGVAPDTSNFSLDPRFCGIASGDLTLSSDSPCASSDPLAVIGACGVGCTLAPTGVAPGAISAAFAVRPNPSRGAVEFALPPAARGGRLDVLDVQGRVVWSRDVGAQARALGWSGETAYGPASPGLYWARFSGAGPVQTRTLIRLR
ncbi:MAG: hypothetical protein HZA61_06900 [Candidatus Eisenbacteria bacterium]|uniref:T9SS type A sorting domain-containing protein n=1 Tax=Eiseniibacteriota bacterium TaxID=2212470 RepID=A0A933WAD5_UNCEI|nr:hypothetical protein [Candidatus Eisenbacteria bacterium]